MTGFGKAECKCGNHNITIEIKSVNGKNSDISLKTQLIPRDKEIEVRKYLANTLQRGNIDLFTSMEIVEESSAKELNNTTISNYIKQIFSLSKENSLQLSHDTILSTALRLPDVIDSASSRDKTVKELEEHWDTIMKCIRDATEMLVSYRKEEGAILQKDVAARVKLIENYLAEIEKLDKERLDQQREKLHNKILEFTDNPDMNRFEQEIIYYLEKLDITEEKVRLKQHCSYLINTIENEDLVGKKLGFISQEVGREINTIGSKANHAGIQKFVVQMKEELEKIKEQVLNIL
jgi:uncharacterized protein (TIGR00255 family)